MATALPSERLSSRLRPFVLPGVSLALFLAAVWAIHRELAGWPLGDVLAAIDGTIEVDALYEGARLR